MRWIPVAFVLVLAGCAAPSDPPAAPAAGGDEEPSRSTGAQGSDDVVDQRYVGNFSSVDTSLFVPGGFFGFEGVNCLRFEGDQLKRIGDGFVQVSWESGSAADETRELVIQAENQLRVSGTSPLRLDLAGAVPRSNPNSLLFMIQPDGYGANVQLPVHFTWDFHYDGKADLTYKEAGCGA